MIVARGGGSLADLFAFCDETLCRTVAMLRVPVISSVGHHTDRTLIDDVAAVCCSTPTHAAEVAVPVDCRAARAELAGSRAAPARPRSCRRRSTRARTLAHLSRAPADHVVRHRRQLHQLLRELRASARRVLDGGRSQTGTQLRVLARSQVRAQSSDTVKRRRELERLALALAAHDPARTLARGYALVEARDGEPLGSAAAARVAGAVSLRFHDGTLPARVDSSEDAP